MKALLSIKPEHVEKIFSGEKRYEYRRKLFCRYDVTSIIIYVTRPVGMIVGEFIIDDILEGELEKIWEGTKSCSGLTKALFYNYFSGVDRGYAIKIGLVKKYKNHINPYEIMPNFVPPQSFRYIDNDGLFGLSFLAGTNRAVN